MAYPGSNKKISFPKSVGYALAGIKFSFRERNMKIHGTAAVLVILAGIFFSISKTEWLWILLCIAGMFSLEMVNTAIEKTVDLVTGEYHPLAKAAKDLAAGAVLIYTVYSIIVGMVVFLPKLLEYFI